MQKNYRYFLLNYLRLSDLLSIGLALFFTNFFIKSTPNFNITIALCLGMWILLSTLLEIYKFDKYTSNNRRLLGFLLAIVLQFGILLAINDLFKSFSLATFLFYVHLTFLFLSLVFRELTLRVFARTLKQKNRKLTIVIINNGKSNDDVLDYLKDDLSTSFQKINLLSLTEDIFNKLDEVSIDDDISSIYIPVSICQEQTVENFNRYCEQNLIQLNLILDWEKVSSKKIYSKQYGQTTMLKVNSTSLDDPLNAIIKRIFDFTFSLVALITIFSWLFPIIAICIKLSSPGPVFFVQKRSGLGTQAFSCLKFRSMKQNKDADKKQAIRNDPRVTPLGSFLRRTSLDELPQFINVLKGEMSIVGPRPHMLKHTSDYSKLVGNFMERHAIKPGITGLAQVKGFRGQISDISMLQNRVRYDRFYVNNWSLFFDIRIIINTALGVFNDHR